MYSGTCGALTSINCDDDGSQATGNFSLLTETGLTPGTTVYVRMWEYGGNAFGTFNVCAWDPVTCPENQDLVGDFIGTGVYSSANNISGEGKITSIQTVKANADLEYNAGKEVILNAGFEVEQNAVFHAYIDGCTIPLFLLSPSDAIIGGQVINDNFEEGEAGFNSNTNNWPGSEPPDHAIDALADKYLNFGTLNTGFIVTPNTTHNQVTGLKIWTANDAEERDPASYEIYGVNTSTFNASTPMSDFTLISSGSLSLPVSRNDNGILEEANSFEVSFTASPSYTSYLIVFPTVKDETTANSMQIGEVQIIGN